ncbi:MAG: S8 family serine peptidase [Leptolyngbyaceae cyanobacterium bins.302]|nr:S8 family serine peptidase [Leptolyngbyaceae cyanobacterium bins.302]
MSAQASFSAPRAASEETTGRYVITFRDNSVAEGMDLLRDQTGIARLANAADFPESALDLNQLETAGGAVFPTLGVAVVSMDNAALSRVMASAGEESAILAVEPERVFYAIETGLKKDYLEGYRDAVDNLYQKVSAVAPEPENDGQQVPPPETFADDAQLTWGLKATKASTSRYTGRGIKVAVLDTGMDLNHPDFKGRTIVSQSFVPEEDVQDGVGHGTHCIGTACGFTDVNGRRYGVAYESTIYVGKVLDNSGSGYTSWILAGMEWAISNQCQVISMSLGNTVPTPSTAYETIGRRALDNGCLIVAAAGNHRGSNAKKPGTVGQPANSPSILSVGAIDGKSKLASFSCTSGVDFGANVDIAAPGVAVYSSVPMDKRYDTYNGTSMATPHVAGIAALYSQAYDVRGALLWLYLVWTAKRLTLPSVDVGSGLVQAP